MSTSEATYQRIDRFHAHLDVCSQCERHPFDLCPTGAKFLKSAATEEPIVLNKRTAGIPAGAVYVGRPTKWGNPMTVRSVRELFPQDTLEEAHRKAVIWYREYISLRPELMDALEELRGRDLVCWCAPLPCHADVLLELVNK